MNEIHTRADLNLFRVLEAIDRTGGVSSAADALHLTQPAVSHALNRLREQLGDPLFIRQGRQLIPTTLARSLLPEIRTHLLGLSRCIDASQLFDPATLNCEFRLGTRDATESLTFPNGLPLLTSIAPGVRIVSTRVDASSLEKELRLGHVDMAAEVRIDTSPDIHSQPFMQEQAVVMYRRDHPLATRKNWLTVQRYSAAQHVKVTLNPDRPDLLDQQISDLGIERHVVLKCQHYFAACQVVARGDWLTTVPLSLAVELSRILPISWCHCPFPIAPIELRLYWHASMENDPGNRWLREFAIDFAQKQQAELGLK